MAYRTYYYLTTDQPCPVGDLPPTVQDALDALELAEHCGGSWMGGDRETVEQLAKISADHPGVLFTVHYDGDEKEHEGYFYFRDGLMQDAPIEIIYPAFNPDLLVEPKPETYAS